MRLKLLIIFSLTFLVAHTYGQTDTGSVYKHLKIKKHCETRCPCIIKSYNEKNILVRKGVYCTDCGVGWFKDFYSNGQVKLSGRYKENPTGNWDSIWNRGYCNVPEGQWIYYDENGIVLYSEYWKDGKFIKQVPEQKKTEIWKIELIYKGEEIGQQVLSADQIKDLVIVPKFKNASTDSVNLSIEFQVTSTGGKYLTQTFTPDSFKLFDLDKLLAENGFESNDQKRYVLRVLNNQKVIAYFNLNILADLPQTTDSLISVTDSTKIIDNNSDFYLVNSSDTTKKVKLIYKIAYDLSYTEPNSDTLIEQKTITLQGYIVHLNKTSLNYEISTESIDLKLKNGFTSWTENDYTWFDYSSNDYLRKVSLKNINSISYTSPARDFFKTFGGATAIFSAITTIIVAPLVSINYKNGDFNKNRYYAVAGSGLIGLSVGIPLIALGKAKTYKLNDKNIDPREDYWYLESQMKKIKPVAKY